MIAFIDDHRAVHGVEPICKEFPIPRRPGMRMPPSYLDIVETCCDAWNFFIDDPATLASTTSRHWAKVHL